MFFDISDIKIHILHAPAFSYKFLTLSSHIRRYVRRTFLSPSLSGSLTLEASIVLPLYIFFLTAIIYILNILYLQNYFQASLEEASRSANRYAYLAEHFEALSFDDMLNISGKDMSFVFNLLKNKADSELVRQAFLSDNVKSLADNFCVSGGCNGLSIINLPSSADALDLYLQYKIKLPFIPEKLITISVSQRCFFKTFTGEDITDKTGDYTQYVYITANASVYHTSPYCSYLSKYYSLFPASYFEEAISDRERYSPCHSCANNVSPSYNVFLCPNSFVYHTKIDCFYLNTNIHKVTLDSIKDTMHICTRCEKGIN